MDLVLGKTEEPNSLNMSFTLFNDLNALEVRFRLRKSFFFDFICST